MNVNQRSRYTWKHRGFQPQTQRQCVCVRVYCRSGLRLCWKQKDRLFNLLVLYMSSRSKEAFLMGKMEVTPGILFSKPIWWTNGCMVQSQRKNYQFISCHASPWSQLCGLLSYDHPGLRKRLFRKATWTSSNSHKILVHLRLWRLNLNPSSFQRRWLISSSACLLSVVCSVTCWGWTWSPALSGDAAEAEWDSSLCHQFTVWKSFRKTTQICRLDFIFLFCRLWEDIGMRWRLSWER